MCRRHALGCCACCGKSLTDIALHNCHAKTVLQVCDCTTDNRCVCVLVYALWLLALHSTANCRSWRPFVLAVPQYMTFGPDTQLVTTVMNNCQQAAGVSGPQAVGTVSARSATCKRLVTSLLYNLYKGQTPVKLHDSLLTATTPWLQQAPNTCADTCLI